MTTPSGDLILQSLTDNEDQFSSRDNMALHFPSHRSLDVENSEQKKGLFKFQDNIKFLLLGSTGNGKSSTANFLTETDHFKESARMQSCTAEIDCFEQRKTLFYAKSTSKKGDKETDVQIQFRVSVFDTPGLNEETEGKELENTRKIIKLLTSIQYVSLILICVRYDEKCDRQFRETFAYYKKLLQRVFDSENWGIMITKLPAWMFRETGAKEYLDDRKTDFEKILGVRVPHIFLFNHREPDEKYKSHNISTRDDILRTVFLLEDKYLENLLFPFPPVFEQHREDLKRSADSNVDTLSRSILETAGELKTNIESIHNFHRQLTDLNTDLDLFTQKVNALSQVVYETPVIEHGHGKTQFFTSRNYITLSLRSRHFRQSRHEWNCTSTLSTEQQQLLVEVIPDWWTWTPHPTGWNWYFKLEISYEGRVVNEKEVQLLTQQIAEIKTDVRNIKEHISGKMSQAEVQNDNYKRYIQQYNEIFYVIERFSISLFSSDQIEAVFLLLEKLLKNNKNIATLDYSQFPDFDASKIFRIGNRDVTPDAFQFEIDQERHRLQTERERERERVKKQLNH